MSTLYGNLMRATRSWAVSPTWGTTLRLARNPPVPRAGGWSSNPPGPSWVLRFRRQAHASPVQLHGELELAWIVGRGRLTRIGEERAYGGDVVLVRDIEHIDDEVGAETLAERNTLRK